MNFTGATHDLVAFGATCLAELLEHGVLPIPCHIVGKGTYIGSNYLLVPVASVHAPRGSSEDAYIYFQSSARMHVEQAFGQLFSRSRVLGSKICFSLRVTIKLIEAAMSMHNFLKNENDVELGQFVSVTEQKEADNKIHALFPYRMQGATSNEKIFGTERRS